RGHASAAGHRLPRLEDELRHAQSQSGIAAHGDRARGRSFRPPRGALDVHAAGRGGEPRRALARLRAREPLHVRRARAGLRPHHGNARGQLRFPRGRVAMKVSVAVALPERQEVIELDLAEGATVADAITAARLAERFPGVDFGAMRTGIWSRDAKSSATLR